MESESESEESSDLRPFDQINMTEVETEALFSFKMAEGHHVFHSKSHLKGLGMSM